MVIDTHTHYNADQLRDNWKDHWQEAQDKGVTSSIIIGTDIESSLEAIEMAEQSENLYATIGIDPEYADRLNIEKLEQIAQNPNVVGIGEIGLDYFRIDISTPGSKEIIKVQKETFIAQLKLANKLNLPISIHVRDDQDDAYDDLLEIIKQYTPQNNFVLHCASGPKHYVKAMINLGAYFGFDGNITYKNAHSLRELLSMIPKDKVVVETDAPYLPPIPYRGKTCLPWMISITAKYIKDNFGISQKQLIQNSKQLFPKIS